MRSPLVRLRRVPPPVLVGLTALVLAGAVAAAWKPLMRQAEHRLDAVIAADPPTLALAVLSASAAVLATAGAWLIAAHAIGSRADVVDGTARYTMGCLAPPKLATPVRIALFARTLPGRRPLWAMTGVCGGLSLARLLPLSVVIVVAAATGAVSLWLGLAIAAVVLVVLTSALAACRRTHRGRLQRLLEGFSLLARTPAAAARVLAWLSLATLARFVAAAATAVALAVPQPLHAALVLAPTLALGRMLPFLGVAAGTIAVGATSDGVGVGNALSLAVAVAAVEALGGILCGITAAFHFVRLAHLRDWRGSVAILRRLRAGRRAAA